MILRSTIGLLLCLYANFTIAQINIPDNEIIIHHINVGQGDATLILGPKESGKRVSILFDCGQTTTKSDKRDGGLIIHQVLTSFGLKSLDYLIISHYDADHLGGIVHGPSASHLTSFALGPDNVPGSLGDDDGNEKSDWIGSGEVNFDATEWGNGDDIKIRTLIDRGENGVAKLPSSITYKKYVVFRKYVQDYRAIESMADIEGNTISLGGGAKMTCLSANGLVRGHGLVENANSENEMSISFLLEYGKFDYFIGGDLIGRRGTSKGPEDAKLEHFAGKYLIERGEQIDVLRTNHHGANNTCDSSFLNLIKAEYAIISVGLSDHGHPHPDHLQRLVDSGVRKIYQTNFGKPDGPLSESIQSLHSIANGHILLTSDGGQYVINGDVYSCDE